MRSVFCAIPIAVVSIVLGLVGQARGDGILEGITGYMEMDYSNVSLRTTDPSGNTTKTELNTYVPTFNINLNYDLYPKLNLSAGATYQANIIAPVNEQSGGEVDVRTFRPYVWLSLRDPLYSGTVGYNEQEATTRTSGQTTTLTQQNYNAYFTWKPDGFPTTKILWNLTNTTDEPRSSVDLQKDYVFLKSEYVYKGLDVWYAGTYQNTQNKISNSDSTQFGNEGRLIYNTMLFNGRTSISTDNRLNVTEFTNTSGGQGQLGLPVIPFVGLSSLNNTPTNGTLNSNPALIDGNLTASAGIDLVLPPVGGVTDLRNMGIDLLTPAQLNSLQVWVSVTDAAGNPVPPQDVTNLLPTLFSWDIYTSSDNLTWTLYRTVQAAPFGPFDSRFEIDFPTVTTRYIKVVTRPVLFAAVSSTNVRQISVTEIQAFLNTSAPSVKTSTTQTFQYYSLDVRTLIFNSPFLSYDFNTYYSDRSPNGVQQYNFSNSLQFNYIINNYLSSSANATVNYGAQGDATTLAFLYNASLLANPLQTLSNSLVFSGTNQTIGNATDTSNSVVLYNTAHLYKGIDANLNVGLLFLSHDDEISGSRKQNQVYVNAGTTIAPTPNLTLTLYYLGRQSHFSGAIQTGLADVTENRLDLGGSWAPFRSLSLSALVSADEVSGQRNNVQQNYAVSWTPFPDGQLQFNLYYNATYTPERATFFQPTLRWYLSPLRRSYLDVSYQINNTTAGGTKTNANIFSTTLKIFF